MNEIVDSDQIFVKSNVARDLLQNAAIFKNTKMVVWEYVSNGLDYIDDGILPVVHVKLDNRNKKITITDTGRGMDIKGLQNFFIMHGENIDRKMGRRGRGRFGTGKSAAFGIADTLGVTTICNKKQSVVVLKRQDIKKMNSDDPIPVEIHEKEIKVDKPNGTMIEIGGIHLKSLDQSGIIQYIERHLANWPNASVYVNNHECELRMPPAVDFKEFQPEGPIKDLIGNSQLIIKTSGTPLGRELCGISIFSNGFLHETTLAGMEGRPMSQFLFGEIDVPLLDDYDGPIPPFDLTRSLKLNPSNEIVQALYAFIGQKVDLVRRALEKKEKERKVTEEAKKLANQANAIALVINEDFYDFRQRVLKAKAKGNPGFDVGTKKSKSGDDPEDLIFGSEMPGKLASKDGGYGVEGNGRSGGEEPRKLRPQVLPGSKDDEKFGKPAGGSGSRKVTRGGFGVEFKYLGKDAYRAVYSSPERTIYINLEHPQLAIARNGNPTDNPIFQRLAYEVAFSEYAVALAAELNENEEYTDTSDPIVDIRETINRIARKAAALYSP